MTIYDFNVLDADGRMVSLKDYEGQVVLINNSATECGFTSQYDDLQNLYETYRDKGFVVLDFPCNQFGNQAPGSIQDIVLFCDSTFGITFPIFDKIDVNGPNESPLYTFLKSQKSFQGFHEGHSMTEWLKEIMSAVDPDYESKSDIKWNFTKFLIDQQGNVVERYEPTADFLEIENRIDFLLKPY